MTQDAASPWTATTPDSAYRTDSEMQGCASPTSCEYSAGVSSMQDFANQQYLKDVLANVSGSTGIQIHLSCRHPSSRHLQSSRPCLLTLCPYSLTCPIMHSGMVPKLLLTNGTRQPLQKSDQSLPEPSTCAVHVLGHMQSASCAYSGCSHAMQFQIQRIYRRNSMKAQAEQ